MKDVLRDRVSKVSSYLEILISILIIVGTLVATIALGYHIFDLFSAFERNKNPQLIFEQFLGFAIQLIIAIEFVKMLAKHTPGSAVEVLLIVIAKRVIVDKTTMFDALTGVLALAILFAIKRFMFASERGYTFDGETVFDGGLKITEFNKMTKHHLPPEMGTTLEDLIINEFVRAKRDITLHSKLTVNQVTLAINEMRDGQITKVEVVADDIK